MATVIVPLPHIRTPSTMDCSGATRLNNSLFIRQHPNSIFLILLILIQAARPRKATLKTVAWAPITYRDQKYVANIISPTRLYMNDTNKQKKIIFLNEIEKQCQVP